MRFWDKIKNSSFYVKIFHWEYWPSSIYNIPVIIIWLLYALRARELFFFSRVNPSMPTGGMMGDSKGNILQLIDPKYVPVTILIPEENLNIDYIKEEIKNNNLCYPIICKPDAGERGKGVEKINSSEELSKYLSGATNDLLVQEFVGYEKEMSVLYYRFPDDSHGHISSICIKEPLYVIGDGKNSLQTLIWNKPRARFQYERIKNRIDNQWIVPKNEKVILEPIGNHCRGTTFLDGNHLISDQLLNVFDRLYDQMQGFHYGRYDFKYKNLDRLLVGKDFKIVELNGTASEPAHIYDPKHSIIYAYRVVFQHWNILYKLSKAMKKRGVPSTLTIKSALLKVRTFVSANKRRRNQRL